jgi:flavin reductase (DIM6/NTAB) family NADH-FMN oxidoreductase RutF
MSSINGPRQVILVTTRANVDIMGREQSKDDIITLAWHMPTSFNPTLYAISVGKTRFSSKLIKTSKVFAVNFMPSSLKKEIIYCGSMSGEHLDKFKETRLDKVEAETIDCPRIKQAMGYLECEVVKEIDTGDHVIFVGKVLKSELVNEEKRLYHIGGDKFTTA